MFRNMYVTSWINSFDYARVLNMPRCSCNNIIVIIIIIFIIIIIIIIIVTNVTLLEFFSAGFVHPNALLPFYLF